LGKLKLNKNTFIHSKLDSELERSKVNEEFEVSDLTKKIINLAIDQKALDTVGFDVQAVSSIAKYIVITSGTSSRHVKGICDNIKNGLENMNINVSRFDGYDEGEWVVLDYDDIIVHIFYEPKRQYFQFDSLMNSAEKLELDDDLMKKVRQFKTGLHAL
jgi:ribosome-associated protein